MQIRGLGRVFRILDDNRNRQIDGNELMWGLKDFDIHLSEEQAACLMKHFDRDGSGTISFDEMLRALRGDLNESRQGWIRKAYDKLDVNKDGLVKLDDIAQLYDVSQHPDVMQGKLSPEQAYRQFMSLWDTQVADGVVTFDEFCDYYRDVSASIDTDEYFGVMMTSAWKL
jgi:calcyphosin